MPQISYRTFEAGITTKLEMQLRQSTLLPQLVISQKNKLNKVRSPLALWTRKSSFISAGNSGNLKSRKSIIHYVT